MFIFGFVLFITGIIGFAVCFINAWAVGFIFLSFGFGLGAFLMLIGIKNKTDSLHPDGLIIKKFVLPDVIIDKYPINCSIKIGEELKFFAEGYGDPFSEDGRGCPIVIENRSGVLTLYVYSDINNEDYTHNITLEKARESNRK